MGKSSVKSVKSIGLSTQPCGVPVFRIRVAEMCFKFSLAVDDVRESP